MNQIINQPQQQAQLPAHLANRARGLGDRLSQNLGVAAPPYVSISNGRFTLVDAAGNKQQAPFFDPQVGVYLDCCIIDANEHVSRIFYDTDYDPQANDFQPPACWSDNGVGPSTQAARPQNAACGTCPNAVWGSAVSAQGKAIPACQQVQKLALIVPQIPNTVFLLRVPPNSHKHLRGYNELVRRSGADMNLVITRIYFDPTTQGTLLFQAVGYIDEQVLAVQDAALAEKKTDGLVGRLDVPRQMALPTPVTGAAPLQGTIQTPQGPVGGFVPPGMSPPPGFQQATPQQPVQTFQQPPQQAPAQQPIQMADFRAQPMQQAPAGLPPGQQAAPAAVGGRRRRANAAAPAAGATPPQSAPAMAPFAPQQPAQNPGFQPSQNPGPQQAPFAPAAAAPQNAPFAPQGSPPSGSVAPSAPAQTTQPPAGGAPNASPSNNFGVGGGAVNHNPELSGMLNGLFGQQGPQG